MNTQTLELQKLYVAFFNRPADPAGLAYWQDAMAAGISLDVVARQFASSPEYQVLYEGTTMAQQVDAIYQNLFGRPAEPAGLTFWSGLMTQGQVHAGNLVLAVMAGAQNADAVTVANKVNAADSFTSALAPLPDGGAYAGTAAAAAARAWLASVGAETGTLAEASASLGAAVSAVIDAGMGRTPVPAVTTVDAPSPSAPAGPQTYTLKAGIDTLVGTTQDDTFDGTALDSFSVSDSIDGGAGMDTLNLKVSGTAAPAGVAITGIETLNLGTTGAGYTIDASLYAGLEQLNLTATAALAGGASAGAINVNGGATVNVTQVTTTTGALGTTATQAAVTVTGAANTSSVSVKQTVATPAVMTVAPSTESAIITWANFNNGGYGYQLAGGLKVHNTDNAYHSQADVATVAAGGTVAGLARIVPETPLWSQGPAIGNTTLFTSLTPLANVADVVVTGSGYTYSPTANTTQGVNAVTGVAGIANGAVSITDVNAASLTDAGTITSVTLDNFGVATVNASALDTATLGGTGTSFALTHGALTTPVVSTLGLNLNGLTTGAVQLGAVPTTINLATSGSASTLGSLSAAGATKVQISGDSTLSIGSHTLAADATITSSGTGAVTLAGALLAGQGYTGGSGADSLVLSASGTRAISTGGGNDRVTYAGPVASGGSIDGGDGTDTLVMTSSQVSTAAGGSSFATTVSGFEVLQMLGQFSYVSLNMANLAGINTVSAAMSSMGYMTISNAAANFTFVDQGSSTWYDSVEVSLANSSGNTDQFNLVRTAADGDANARGSYFVNNVERLAITTSDTDALANTAKLATRIYASAATTINISGDMGMNISSSVGSALTLVDASGLTASGEFGGLTFTTSSLTASSVIKGGAAGANTVNFSGANTASTFVTYVGGSGADTITGSNGRDNTVTLGDGTNSFTSTGAGNNTITGGAGSDTINVGTGGNTISTAGGNDGVQVGASTAASTIDVGSGTDTLVLAGIQTSATNRATVTGMGTGDVINLAATNAGHVLSGQTSLGNSVTPGGTPTLADCLNAATAGDGATAATLLRWFQLDGDTYLVHDTSSAATFQDGQDSVVQLVGLIDLSAATVAAGVITL